MEKTFQRILMKENFTYICENNKITFTAVHEGKKWNVLISCNKDSFSIYCFYPWDVSKDCSKFCNTHNIKLREGKFIYDEVLRRNVFQYGRSILDEYTKQEVCERGLKLAISTVITLWYEFYNFMH